MHDGPDAHKHDDNEGIFFVASPWSWSGAERRQLAPILPISF